MFTATADTPEVGTPPTPRTVNARVSPLVSCVADVPNPAIVFTIRVGDSGTNVPPAVVTVLSVKYPCTSIITDVAPELL